MNRKTRLYAAVSLVALFVAGCSGPCSTIKPITAPEPAGGTADFSSYVAMGASIGAGYQSGGLVYRHQLLSYPALFAGQAGAEFTYPAISDSGIPELLQLSSLAPSPVILKGHTLGSPTNLALPTAYTNLSVPGAILFDATSSARYADPTSFFPVILRGRGTVLAQATSLSPTFVSIEYGANEVLGAATSGSGTPAFTVEDFTGLIHGTLNAAQSAMPNAKFALFNVLDVTTIPFVTTVKPFKVLSSGTKLRFLCDVDAAHPTGQLNDDDYVLLTASSLLATGTGIPVPAGGNGNPLPGTVVLTAAEAASLKAAVSGYNAAIAAEAAARGAALVDLHGLLVAAATTGIQVGGARYTGAFLTGGLYSLDGVHPNDLCHGLIANRMIDAVNATFGASVPHVSLSDVETYTASSLRPAAAEEGATAFPRIEGLEATVRMLNHRR